jgi:hypothetical protein
MLTGKPERKTNLGRPRSGRNFNINMDLWDFGFGVWI